MHKFLCTERTWRRGVEALAGTKTAPAGPVSPMPSGGGRRFLLSGTVAGERFVPLAGGGRRNGRRGAGDVTPTVGLGTWQATCADGSSGGGVLNVNEVLFLVTVLGLPVGGSSLPFEGCGWGGTGTRNAARIEGAWETAEGEGCPAAITGTFTVQP